MKRRVAPKGGQIVNRLSGRRVLLVGASSGIGRAIAIRLAGEGALLSLAARRAERLEELAGQIHPSPDWTSCDVRDPSACESTVRDCVERWGGLDALVYAAGIAPLAALRDADATSWRSAFETNVMGASLLTRCALPHLVESRGRAVYLSSIAATEKPPRTGLGLYLTTKAALDRLVEVWQAEEQQVGFTRLSVGDTAGTEMAAEWEPAAARRHIEEWVGRGLLFGRTMEPSVVAQHVADLLASGEAVPVSSITPRFAVDD